VKPLTFVIVPLAGLTLIAACGSPGTPSSAGGHTARPAGVSVQNCGAALSLPAVPSRAVSNDINSLEYMLALGLADRMVGAFGVSDDAASTIPPDLQADAKKVPRVSPKYVTLEPLLGQRPDFLFAGWNYGLHRGSATLTPAALATHGISTLALTESCAHVQSSVGAVSLEDTYTDLTNLGDIFRVRPKADQLVAQMQQQVSAVRQKVSGKPVKTVFDYDGGTDAPFTAPGLAMPTALIALAGGRNVVADLKQTWTTVSWEKVAAANPDCVLINDYDTPSWQAKKQFFATFALTKNTKAAKDDCFFHLRYDQVTPSPQNATSVEALARWLHPDAFTSG
jgi:iron complex transport system substrate-binding protein